MTDEKARTLRPGDRIRLIARIGWDVNPPQRDTFIVRWIEDRIGFGGVRIGTEDDFWFIPQDIEVYEGANRP